jgi:hypothetical protein
LAAAEKVARVLRITNPPITAYPSVFNARK